MTFFLTSSPCLGGADRAVLNPANGLIDRLRDCFPAGARCLFMCSNPDLPQMTDRFGSDMESAFAEAGMPFSSLTVCDGRNWESAAALVASSNFIILAGGHVPTQNRFFRKIGLRALLEGFSGVIMGISAGTMNSADIVYAQPELPGESTDPTFERFLPGLGLTKAMVLPHYQQVRDLTLDGKRLFEDITYADSVGRTFYALPDGSYLFGQDGKTLLLGEAYRIENGRCTQIASSGDCTVI